MDINDFVENIKSKKDFIRFTELLTQHLANSKQEWQNPDLESYLEGIQGFVEDMDGRKLHFPSFDQTPSWKLFAQILIAATIYE